MAYEVYTPKEIYMGQPGTTITTLYTVPTGTKIIINAIDLVNTTANAATVTVYTVPNGGTYGAANMLVPPASVNGNSVVHLPFNKTLEASAVIQALQSTAGAITVHISGVTVSSTEVA